MNEAEFAKVNGAESSSRNRRKNSQSLIAVLRQDMAAMGLKNLSIASIVAQSVFHQGLSTVLLYRLSHLLAAGGGRWRRILAKLVARVNTIQSSCHISPYARIGPGLNLPHATGIVIGEGTIIGENNTIYQHVTFGQRHSSRDQSAMKYPVVGEGGIFFSGAVIVGAISIGDRVIIGANSVVMMDVPSQSIAAGVPAVF